MLVTAGTSCWWVSISSNLRSRLCCDSTTDATSLWSHMNTQSMHWVKASSQQETYSHARKTYVSLELIISSRKSKTRYPGAKRGPPNTMTLLQKTTSSSDRSSQLTGIQVSNELIATPKGYTSSLINKFRFPIIRRSHSPKDSACLRNFDVRSCSSWVHSLIIYNHFQRPVSFQKSRWKYTSRTLKS